MRHCIGAIFSIIVSVLLLEGGSYVILKHILKVPLVARRDSERTRALYVWNRNSEYLPYGVRINYRQRFNTEEFQTIIKTNNAGLREEKDYQGEPVDIGFAGDSMTFGWGVDTEERYSDKLREFYPDKRILSYGYRDGLTTPHYYLFFKNNPQYIPKILILGLYPDNDLDVDMRDTRLIFDNRGELTAAKFTIRYVTEEGALGVGYDVVGAGPLVRRIGNSYTGKLLWLGWLQSRSIYNRTKFGIREKERYYLGLEYVQKLKQLVAPPGTRLIVFMMPPRAHFLGKQYPLWEETKTWFKDHAIEFIDPVEQFKERGGANLYYPKDTHWNPEGHRVAAQVLYNYLERSKL